MDSKSLIQTFLAVAALAGGPLTLGACKRGDAAGDAKPSAGKDPAGAASADRVVPVVAVPVIQRDMPVYLDGLGNVVAWATVTVHTLVDGRIDQINFHEGQEVHKGDLLAQIDPRPFENQLHTAEATMARDRAQLAGAKTTLARDQALLKEGLINQQTVDDQVVAVAAAEATLGVDQAAIDTARLSINYAHITSPLDGVTGIRLVDQGNIVHQTDAGGMVVLTQLDPIAVIFTLPQDDLTPIQRELAKGPVTVEAMDRDGTTKLATGELVLIDNQINTTTATIRLKAKFPNADRMLWPNAFVKTRLLLATRKNALVVPNAVVQRGPQGTFAYVVDADSKAQMKPITVDLMEGENTLVSSGLSAGDQVVTDGQNQLKPGFKVQVSAPLPESTSKPVPAKPLGPPKEARPPAAGSSAPKAPR